MLIGTIVCPCLAAPKKQPARKVRGPVSVRQILAAESVDKKGLLCVRFRRGGISAADLMTLIRSEREPSIVALVAGMAFESGSLEQAGAVKILAAMVRRKGLAGKTAVIAACSPMAGDILTGLTASSPQDRKLAANIAAIYAYEMSVAWDRDVRSTGGKGGRTPKRGDKAKNPRKPRAKAGKKGVAARRGRDWFGSVDLEPIVAKLLNDRSIETRELAVLAAAYARIEKLADTIEGMKVPPAAAGLQAARLFYLARIGRTLPPQTVRATIRARVRPDARFVTLSPAMNSYDIRGNAIIYTCQAVATARDAVCLTELHKLLQHRDLRIQIEAARAIEQIRSPESIQPLLAKLKDRRLTWPVKVAVLSAIGAIPDVRSVEPLLAMQAGEKGRFRQDVAYALASINCGKHGDNPKSWRTWWAENRETFKIDVEATAKWRREHRVQDIDISPLADFYGVDIISDRIVFVLDTSASMRGDKIASLKETMAQTLSDMPEFVKFNIVDFGGVIRVMNRYELMKGILSGAAASEIGQMGLSLGTRTFDAMEVATELRELDSIMYLSDGAPVAGQFQAWGSITRGFDLYIRYRPISIHCIYYTKGGGKDGAGANIKSIKAGAASYQGIPGGMKRLVDHHIGRLSLPGRNGEPSVGL